jgi:GT2 family glycosyltransferase
MLDDVALPTNGEFFCEDFFIYGEDHDLGWRSLLRGWECWYTPSAIGYHIGFGSGGMSHGRIQAEFTRNRYLTLLRNDALLHVAMDLHFIVLYELILQGSYLLRSPKRLVWHWRGIIDSIGTSRRVYSARKIIQAHRRATPADVRSFVCSKLW